MGFYNESYPPGVGIVGAKLMNSEGKLVSEAVGAVLLDPSVRAKWGKRDVTVISVR